MDIDIVVFVARCFLATVVAAYDGWPRPIPDAVCLECPGHAGLACDGCPLAAVSVCPDASWLRA